MKLAGAADLAASLERRITGGELVPGSRLEPVRAASDRLGLAPNTVAAAYRSLAERGLVVARGRLGTFVEARLRPTSESIPEVPPGLVDLASGEPDPALLPDLAPILAALDGSTATYGDPSVNPGLEAAARQIMAAEGVESRLLAVTGGAVDGIERALGAWLRPGDAVAVEDPGWFAIADLVRAMGLVPVPVAIDSHGIVPDRLVQVLGRVGAVVLTPRAQNPTGAWRSPSRAAELTEVLAARPEVLVIEDDHIGPMAGPPLAVIGPGMERWAYIRSFSKSLGPDLRTAVVTGDDTTLDQLLCRQMVGPGWVSHILQRAVAGLLDSPTVVAGQEKATAAYAERRRFLADALDGNGLPVGGDSGLNLWVPVDDEEAAVRAVRERGYAIRAGSRFRHRSRPGVRVTISQIDERQAGEVAEALAGPPARRMSRAV
jgi:DNA-binding transcriptional MocR family regulator